MTRRSVVKIAALVIGVPLLLLAIVVLYLNFADLSGWRDTLASAVSDAIGRELKINGEFQPEIGFTTRVVASDITLANPAWSDDPNMVAVDQLAGEVDLLSFLFGPITIRDVEITGARVLFEVDTEGRFNWALGSGRPGDGSGGEVELVIGHAVINDLQLVYAPHGNQTLQAELAHFDFTDDGTGMLDVDLEGSLEGTPLEISGRLGTFIGLINANRVEHDLSGRFADAEFALQGTIGDLSSLSGVDAEASIGGPDLSQIMAAFRVDTIVDGPYSARVSIRQAVPGSDFELQAKVGEMSAGLTGSVDSLVDPGFLDVSVDVSGPNVATIGSLAGAEDLPTEPFAVTGRVQWEGFPLRAENVEVRVGNNTLSAHGVLGKPPLMMGTDFVFNGGGPDISAVAALAGLKVPQESYSVDGRLVRLEGALGVEKIEIEVGQIILEVDGRVGDPPTYDGTALRFRGEGPDLARLQSLVGIDLPAESFEVSGKLAKGEGAIELEEVRVRLGGNNLEVDGQLVAEPGFVGTDLHVKAEGPDASAVAALADVSTVPAEEFSVDCRIRVLENGYRVNDLAATLGSLGVNASGYVAPLARLIGSDLQIHLEDSDLSHPASIAGIADLPHDSINIATRLRIEEEGYRLDDLVAAVGDMEVHAEGLIRRPPNLEGTEIGLTVGGPKLSSLDPYVGQRGLPPTPFSASGKVRFTNGAYALDQVVAEIGGTRTTVAGVLQPANTLVGTDLEVEVSGSSLLQAGELAAGFFHLPPLPAEAFALATRFQVDEDGYLLERLRAELGNATTSIHGRVGALPELFGTDLTFDGHGPDSSLFKSLTGISIGLAPFQFNGRVERTERGFRFHQFSAKLGEYRLALDGTLGEPPKLIGTDLEIHASGPDTNLYEALAGLPDLPDKPFTLDGRLGGTPQRFSSRDFKLTFGRSDIQGSFTIDISDKPAVVARLDSQVLDLSNLHERLEAAEDATQSTPPEANDAKKGNGVLLFPDEPLHLAWLQSADANVEIRIDQLYLRALQFRDLSVDVRLEDGRLELERAAAAGRGEGRLTGSLLLEPHQETYRLETDISLRQIRLDPPDAVTQLLQRPPIDIDIDLEAVGASPHELASSTNGAIQLVIGQGHLRQQHARPGDGRHPAHFAQCVQPVCQGGPDHRAAVWCRPAQHLGRYREARADGLPERQDDPARGGQDQPRDRKAEPQVGDQTAQGHRPLSQHDDQPLHQARRHVRQSLDRAQTAGGRHLDRCCGRDHGHLPSRQGDVRPCHGRKEGL